MKTKDELFSALSVEILNYEGINTKKFENILLKLKETLEIISETDPTIYSHYINSRHTRQLCLILQNTPSLIDVEQGGVENLLLITKYTADTNPDWSAELIIKILGDLSTGGILSSDVNRIISEEFKNNYEALTGPFKKFAPLEALFILAAKYNSLNLLEELIGHKNFHLTDEIVADSLQLQTNFDVAKIIIETGAKINAGSLLLAEFEDIQCREGKKSFWKPAKVWEKSEERKKWVELLLSNITIDTAHDILFKIALPKEYRDFHNEEVEICYNLISRNVLINGQKIERYCRKIEYVWNSVILFNAAPAPLVSENLAKIANALVTWISNNWNTLSEQSNVILYKRLALSLASVLAPKVYSEVVELPCKKDKEDLQRNLQRLNYHDGFKPLGDVKYCLDLLKPLEKYLAAACKQRGVDLSVYTDISEYVLRGDFVWPIPSLRNKPKTFGLLNKLLLAKERQYQINTDPNAPLVFSGFIPKNIADDYVRRGNLFIEFKGANEVLHGIYSHRLQWYLLFLHLENVSNLGEGIDGRKLLAEKVENWGEEFDSQYGYGFDVGFHSPHVLHSVLLNSQDQLPTLCYYLRKLFASSLRTVIAAQGFTNQGELRISAGQLVRLNTFSHNDFGFANVRLVTPIEHYKNKKGKLISLHEENSGKENYFVFFKQHKNNSLESTRSQVNNHEHVEKP